MLGELLAAIESNDRRAPVKGRVFKGGFAALVISLAGAFLVSLLR
jgi:hypothetical protein